MILRGTPDGTAAGVFVEAAGPAVVSDVAAAQRRDTIAWARQMLHPGAAVILDTETTDLFGSICEIAVIDTMGRTLLNTLVRPECPMVAEAEAVHGITDRMVLRAPSLGSVLPKLLAVTRGRQVLAYNSFYDHEVLLSHAGRLGLELRHLAHFPRWGCVMQARAIADGTPGECRGLHGGHRALGDTQMALEVLYDIARDGEDSTALAG